MKISVFHLICAVGAFAAMLCAPNAPAQGYHNLPRATDQPAFYCAPEWPRRIVGGRTYYFTGTCYECPSCTVPARPARGGAPRFATAAGAVEAPAKTRTEIRGY
jgi:hypothetical protein